MKKILLFLIPLTFLLSGCSGEELASEISHNINVEEASISDELAQSAFENIFILAFATLAPTDEMAVETEGNKITYTFNNTHYRPTDSPSSTVKGYLTISTNETSEDSEASYTFTNDPGGVKTVSLKSSTPIDRDAGEGEIVINGAKRSLAEFIEYINNKLD